MDYDFEGNRINLQASLSGNVSYAWQNQRLQSMVLIAGAGKSAQVDLSYDSVGRLASLTRIANWDASTTIHTNFTLDLLDRVTSITHQKVMGEITTTLSAFSYSFDANGRVASYSGPEGSLSFALDTNGQLLSVTGARAENYQYDPVGNRSATITAPGNLLLNDGKYSYTYDLKGNLKTQTRLSDGQLTEYFWDHRNQLTKALVKDANGVLLKELRFTYDVQGRRVGVWVDADGAGPGNPGQVWTVFDGANPYMDFDGEGQLKTRYLHGPGIDELFARIGTGEDPQWHLTDRLGSVRQIVDAAGTVLDDIDYDSFGGILNETNPAQGDRFKFTGREYSPELGIYYYRARWYDPAVGRFINQDPIRFRAGDPNLYRYANNAPGDATDPEGLVKIKVDGTIYYVHPNDLDDKPSKPHAHINNPNSPYKVDIKTGQIFHGGKPTGTFIGRKSLEKLIEKILSNKNLGKGVFGACLFLGLSSFEVAQAYEENGLQGGFNAGGQVVNTIFIETVKSGVAGSVLASFTTYSGWTFTAWGLPVSGAVAYTGIGGLVLTTAGTGYFIGNWVGEVQINNQTIHDHIANGMISVLDYIGLW